jgi:hypothetical protein
MAKPLRQIVTPGQTSVSGVVKDAKLDGVKSSTTSDLTLGKNPGVDYDPKAKSERDFVAKHKVEKHADRVGNKEAPYEGNPKQYVLNSKKEKRHGNMLGQAEKVYEGRGMKCESCGSMYEGESCGCGNSDMETKKGKKLLLGGKKLQEVLRVNEGAKVDRMAKHIESSEKASGVPAKKAKEIAWATLNKRGYLDNKNKKVQEDLAMPMLEDGPKKKKGKTQKESAPADTPITFPSGNVGDTGRV